MAGHCNQGYNMEDHDEGHTNFEMDELRRQLQKLQQRLEQYENQGRGARHHDFESDDENPFHRVHSHSSSGSTPPHPRLLRNLQLGFDMKVDVPELAPLPIRERILKQNEKYSKQANKYRKPVAFKEGDLVWIHLRKEQFPSNRSFKLMPRADDLSPYYEDQEDQVDLGASLHQPGRSESDGGVAVLRCGGVVLVAVLRRGGCYGVAAWKVLWRGGLAGGERENEMRRRKNEMRERSDGKWGFGDGSVLKYHLNFL
uniref:Uncharacterized protein n=1 Tax=Fagus sylvatica TaxID=28930 RepID=A0A2N9G5N1_FAGSY